MTLGEMKRGERAAVAAVRGEGAFRLRLLDMGFVPRTEVRIVRRAPAGDPIEVELRGYSLTLRREDAKIVEVKKL